MNYQTLPPKGNLFDTARTLRQPGIKVAAVLDCSTLTPRVRSELVRTLLAAHSTKGWRSSVRHLYEALCKSAGVPFVITYGTSITMTGPLLRLDPTEYAQVKDFYETDVAVRKMSIHSTYRSTSTSDRAYEMFLDGKHGYTWGSCLSFNQAAFFEQATEVITKSLLRQHPEYAALAEQVKAGASFPITL